MKGVVEETPETKLKRGAYAIGEVGKTSEGLPSCNVVLKTKNTQRIVKFEFVWNPETKEVTSKIIEGKPIHKDVFERVRADVVEKIEAFLWSAK